MGLVYRVLCFDCKEYAELDKFWCDCFCDGDDCKYDNEYLNIMDDIDGWDKDQLAYHLAYVLKALRFYNNHKGHDVKILHEDNYGFDEPKYIDFSTWKLYHKNYDNECIQLLR